MTEIKIIGGINIDIEGSPSDKLKYHDSNPGKIKLSYGGVGRNIAENVLRIGGKCGMLSAVGDDHMSIGAKTALKKLGCDTSHIIEIEGRSPSMYLSILDGSGDMEIAISDMGIIDAIDSGLIVESKEWLADSEVIALDGNLMGELLDFVTRELRDSRFFFDPVSASKGIRAKDFIGRFFAIKPNIIEAETILGLSIENDEDIRRAGERFMELGVKQVYITLNKDGVYFRDENEEGFLRPKEGIKVISATGAGDSFSACILYGIARGLRVSEIAKMGMAAAEITMESTNAVNPDINIDEIRRRMK